LQEQVKKESFLKVLFASVVDTGGNFATRINDTAANLPPVSMTPVANNGDNIRLLRP
jgi:hypothetical protein